MRNLLYLSLLFLLLGCTESLPQLKVVPSQNVDFGAIPKKNARVDTIVYIKNIGDGKLYIKDIKIPCNCIRLSYKKRALKEGDPMPVRIIMEKRHADTVSFNYSLDIVSNSIYRKNSIKLHLKVLPNRD